MKAVILAAGEGTRMRPLTYSRPKVMLTIANKPILEYLLLEFKQAGISEFVFVVGYHEEQVRDYFGDGRKWDVAIQYCSQRKQLGTADALKMVKGLIDGRFLMVNGDAIIDHQYVLQLTKLNANVMTVVELADVKGLGVIETRDDKVVRLYEKMVKPPSHLANAGLYLFAPEIFEAVDKTPKSLRGEYEVTDSIQLLIDNGIPVYYQKTDKWLDFSYPWDLLTANEMLMKSIKSQQSAEIEDNVILKGAVVTGQGTIVRSGAYIVGPVIIGQNCEIGPNCFIRPCTAIADNCHIGASVEIKNSIIMKNTKVPHLNYVGDSIIGEDCNLGAGTKIANLKLDKKNVVIDGKDTGRYKMGAIIGNGVQIGINASINTGSMIGDGTLIGPGALVHGVISPGSRIF